MHSALSTVSMQPSAIPSADTDQTHVDCHTDEARWQAVLRRDPLADGQFFYAVKTTGVYCRPSCGSRVARRENVSFFPTATAAQRAGYRACKRCRPDENASLHARLVENACRTLSTAEAMPALAVLAADAGLSPFHFHRVFRSRTGLTPRAYFAAQRAARLRQELATAPTVTEAVYAAGFNSSSRFYEHSEQMLGMKPRSFRSGGEGERIRFGVAQTSLGALLVAATDKGICSIALGDDPAKLVHDLQHDFPRATLIGDDAQLEEWIARVIALVESPGAHSGLPLDVRGTAFQQRVWQALRNIPSGSTMTYEQVAKAIGAPNSARAVARACATNPTAIAVPCHRVVRKGGALSGYRWGVERKRELLEREAKC